MTLNGPYEQDTRRPSAPLDKAGVRPRVSAEGRHIPTDGVDSPLHDPLTASRIAAGVRCAHCPVRAHAPCRAMSKASDLVELELNHAPLRHIPAGSTLFEQGSPSDRSYTILRGWLAVSRTASDGRLGILRFALPGDVVGYQRRDGVNSCSAVAVGDVTVCSLTRARQERLERAHPTFDAGHRAAQEETLELVQQALSAIVGRNALERVSHLLLQLAWRSLRRRPSPGEQVEAPLSQIQIGLATGLTPVHVSRTLRQLRETEVADVGGRRLKIDDPATLERLAGVSPETAALWE